MTKVTGTWHGQYTYGQSYGARAGASVPFALSLTESELRLAGYVRDDSTRGGMEERGRVSGHRRGSDLSFVKTMPVGWMAGDDGKLVHPRDVLRTQHGIDTLGDWPAHRIEYLGTLTSDGNSLAGTWRIKPAAIDTDRGVLEWGSGEGTWTARRVSDLPTEV